MGGRNVGLQPTSSNFQLKNSSPATTRLQRKMSSSTESSALFTPLKVGRLTLSHRIVLAPMTRSRATKDHVHASIGVEYYAQRSSIPGSLLITEATVIHPAAGAYYNTPYIYTDAQVQAWKEVRLVHTHRQSPV